MAKNILLVAGGDGSEHEISLISAKYVEQKLRSAGDYCVLSCVFHDHKFIFGDGRIGYFTQGNHFVIEDASSHNNEHQAVYETNCLRGATEDMLSFNKREELVIDCAVPCLHGTPGETGEIQAFFKLHNVPFIGCGQEASVNCFNKVSTKFYLSSLNIENTPSIFVSSNSEADLKRAHEAFNNFGGDVYVKAASEGSSIGCYHVKNEADLDKAINDALGYSQLVLIEKTIVHRELEVAAFEYQGKLHITNPGEIIIPSDLFYTFDEKYSSSSSSTTTVEVEGLSPIQLDMLKSMAERAFKGLNLRHLSRIDFFLAEDGTILLNEINTFPGMTPISMFPKLVEHSGVKMEDFFKDCIESAIAEKANKA